MCDECRNRMQGMPKELRELLESLAKLSQNSEEQERISADKAKAEAHGVDGIFYWGEKEFFFDSNDLNTLDAAEAELMKYIDELNVMPGSFWVEAGKHMARAFICEVKAMLSVVRLGNEHENRQKAIETLHNHGKESLGLSYLMGEKEARAELDRAMGGLKLPDGPTDTIN